MNSKFPDVNTVVIRLITDKPVRKTPYQVKGVIMRQYPNEEIVPLLDGTYREKFLYPRVQVKILNEQIYIVGVGAGVKPIKLLAKKLESMDFGNITFQVLDLDIEESSDRFQPVDKLIRYRFVTPWVALNQTTGSRYRFLNNVDRINFLNRLLGQNIVFMAREMGMELDENIFTKVTLSSLFPRPVDENNWGAFEGEFRANFILPNYLGIGNGITRGYGTILGLFNPEMFSFDKENIEKDAEPVELEKSELKTDKIKETDLDMAESGIQEIDVEKVPRPRQKEIRKKVSELKRSKKILSEEFSIEDDSTENAFKAPRQPQKKSRPRPRSPQKSSEKISNESNFNTAEFHKKQHKL
ncbi:MAG: CRISPR-associated endonuclease Cas6 [Candidatus Neomarinimicrobiota bacterium]